MKYKIWMILSVFIIFILSAILHSIYNIFPSFLTSLFFPVNESIWEHNKMIFMAYFIFMILEKIFFKKSSFNYIFPALICSILILLIFSPIYFFVLKMHDNLMVTLIIYFLTICLAQIYYYFLKPNLNCKGAIFLWLIIFILNAFLTYFPFHHPIFYDYKNQGYGIICLKKT